ncbi:hypothetical protein [Clostridium sp.]|uniref:hypothetical protein n=1 Tax=Clostridium sp. TaxID=1506 RepID=UPI0026DC4C19|nr:hypothetical protein [Clostridium sp.]MDO5038819.1 hypothetical protein [Clostridium sp.]
MESNRKYKLSFRNMIKFGNKIFKKYFLLFNLVILIYIGVICYFGHYNINKILDFNRIIINGLFWLVCMSILWIGCLSSYVINILKAILIEIIYEEYEEDEQKEVNNIFKIILFTVVFALMEFFILNLVKLKSLESDHIFYLYSMGVFVGCYFGIVKNIK